MKRRTNLSKCHWSPQHANLCRVLEGNLIDLRIKQTSESKLNSINPCCSISASCIHVIEGFNTGKSSLRTEYIPTSHPTIMPGTKAKSAQGLENNLGVLGLIFVDRGRKNTILIYVSTWPGQTTMQLHWKQTWRQKADFIQPWWKDTPSISFAETHCKEC